MRALFILGCAGLAVAQSIREVGSQVENDVALYVAHVDRQLHWGRS